MKGTILEISHADAVNFLLPRHYSGRMPSVSIAFGWYVDNELKSVCTFGKPASNSLCRGICGDEHSKSVYELNRLCRLDDFDEQLSCFVSACLRRLRAYNWIIVSYSDTSMHHNGYIYQACNFIYTGRTKERTDKYTDGNKHSRHYSNTEQGEYRKVRSAKNRYVFFCTKDKHLKNEWMLHLNYPILPYPKEANENYKLGDFQAPVLQKISRKEVTQ